MAQVTMSNQEYLILQRKADKYDKLFEMILDNVELTADNDSWLPVSVSFRNRWSDEIQRAIIERIAQLAVENPTAMELMYKNRRSKFDMENFSLDNDYGGRMYQGEYSLLDIPEFKDMWDATAKRIEASVAPAEDTEVMDEAPAEEEE